MSSTLKDLTFVQTALCGGTAGLVTRLVISPLDVVKIRLQLQVQKGIRRESMIQTFVSTVRNEGLRALWKGNWSAQWLYVTYGAVQFTTYDAIKRIASKDVWYSNTFAGALAGMTATILTYPFDTLRTRFAAQTQSLLNSKTSQFVGYRSIWHAIYSIKQMEGLGGFYRGLNASLIQIAPYMGVMFTTYEGLQRIVSSYGINQQIADLTCGAIAGTIGKASVMPLDVIRKRMQVQSSQFLKATDINTPTYRNLSIVYVASQMVRNEGWLSLFKGLLPSLLKAGPSSAITFLVYGFMVKQFNR